VVAEFAKYACPAAQRTTERVWADANYLGKRPTIRLTTDLPALTAGAHIDDYRK
jgi:hypothetical protein